MRERFSLWCTVLYSRLLECMRSSINLWCYLFCPARHHICIWASTNHHARCNLPRPYYPQTPLSLCHLAFDSPTHSAIQRLALSIPFFLSFFLTHATSQMGSILWAAESSWADTLTDSEELIPSSQEPMKDMLKGNQSGFSANSWLQRKHRQTGGKRETEERKSATPRGDFFLSWFFPPKNFSSTQAIFIFKQHVKLEGMIQREIQVFS